ncbi:MAG: amidase [Halomonas sp.]|uniref:amidase n=1 Tax=Halomonas sp. TaxID=1486246 RepID=UPI003F90A176
MNEVINMSLAEVSERVAAQKLSPVELVDLAIQCIRHNEPHINAFVSVWEEEARQQARQAEDEIAREHYRGPLHGIPIALKDLYDMAGKPTTASSQQRIGHQAKSSSAVAQALQRGGAIIVGKTHTHEFAFGLTTPQTANPRDRLRTPGGSSGGSAAAVAYGGVWGAMGTDTGGSIRVPSALCGIVGFKPTYGVMSVDGITPLSWSLDHAGPMARSVEDVYLMCQVIGDAGKYDVEGAKQETDRQQKLRPVDMASLTVGVPRNYYFDHVAEPIAAAVYHAADLLVQQGAKVVEMDIPLSDYLIPTQWGIMVSEAASVHGATIRQSPELYGEDVRILIESGQLLLATDYLKAQRARGMIQKAWQGMFENIDVLLTPTVPQTAAWKDQKVFVSADGSHESVSDAYVRLCAPSNVTGLPSLTLPYGQDADGLPIGVQLIGKAFTDYKVLQVGKVIENH